MRDNTPNPSSWDTETNFKKWNADQVANWLLANNFGEYGKQFVENNITGDLLLQLNYTWLKEIGVLVVGDRARILQAIQRQFLRPNQDSSKSIENVKPNDKEAEFNAKLENRKGLLPPPNDKSPRSSTAERVRSNRSFSDARKHPPESTRFDKSDDSPELTPKQLRKASTEKSNPLQIYPRTSSRKESNSNKQLNEAYDVIFGSSPKLSTQAPPMVTPSVKTGGRTSKTSAKSPKATESPVLGERDIMKMRGVREVMLFD